MAKKINTIGVLGANGFIGTSLVVFLLENNIVDKLFVFSRNIDSFELLRTRLVARGLLSDKVSFCSNNEFVNINCDLVINCAGVGSPNQIKKSPEIMFEAIDSIDRLIYQYFVQNPNSCVISISSGSVYGTGSGQSVFPCNEISQKYYYPIAKLCSEARHRSWSTFNISDIRVYAFASEFVDVDAGFLIGDIFKAAAQKTVLSVGQTDIVRDYIGVEDLFALIELVYSKRTNDVFEIFSVKPLSKFELLDSLSNQGLITYEVSGTIMQNSTGSIDVYAPSNKSASFVGYIPKYTSVEIVHNALRLFLKDRLI